MLVEKPSSFVRKQCPLGTSSLGKLRQLILCFTRRESILQLRFKQLV
jgi:hypothetical protein